MGANIVPVNCGAGRPFVIQHMSGPATEISSIIPNPDFTRPGRHTTHLPFSISKLYHCFNLGIMLPNPSPRKRRRPALACASCRRRKVKCDRNSPCGQCTLRNSDLCTYTKEGRTTIIERNKRRPEFAVTTEVSGEDACILNQPQYLDNIADQGAPGDTANAAETSLTERTSGSHRPHNTFLENHKTTKSPLISSASGPILGTLSKTRIFGHGHWRNIFPLVCAYLL